MGLSQTKSMPKQEFIHDILPKLLALKNHTSVNLMGYTVDVAVSGNEKAKDITRGTAVSNDTQEQVEQGIQQMDIMNIDMIKS